MDDIKQFSCGMFALVAVELLIGLGVLMFIGWVVIKLLQYFGVV